MERWRGRGKVGGRERRGIVENITCSTIDRGIMKK